MPRRRRVAKMRTPPFQYTPEAALFLTCGQDYFNERPFGDPVDMELARAVWQEHRDELLSKYVADHPGRRPWAWWQFDAPDSCTEDEDLRRLGLLSPSEREYVKQQTIGYQMMPTVRTP